MRVRSGLNAACMASLVIGVAAGTAGCSQQTIKPTKIEIKVDPMVQVTNTSMQPQPVTLAALGNCHVGAGDPPGLDGESLHALCADGGAGGRPARAGRRLRRRRRPARARTGTRIEDTAR